jgi:hypothetical protein
MDNEGEHLLELLLDKEPYQTSDERTLDQKTQNKPISEEESRILETIKEYLKKESFQWDENKISDYKFNLPETVFSEARQLQLLNYEDAEVDYEDNENEVLSEENIRDINLKGEFSIKSKKGKVYVWKLSTWLIQGSENRFKNFQDDMGIIFEMFYYYKYRVNTKFKYANIYRVAKNFYYFVRDFFRLVIGTPFTHSNNEQFTEKINTEYYEKVLKSIKINTQIYYPNASNVIRTVYNKFIEDWNSKKYIHEQELRSKNLTEEEKKIKILEMRLDKMIEYLKNHNEFKENGKISDEMQETLFMLIKAKHIVLQIENDHLNKVDLMKKQLMESIIKENPILSKTSPWKNKTYFTEEKIRIIELEKERYRERQEKLKDYQIALYLVNSYEELEREKIHKINKLNEEKPENPRGNFYYNFSKCFPVLTPYEYNNNGNMETRYRIDYSNQVTTTSGYYFWRFVRFYYLLIYMLWEILVWLKYCLFNSSLGIRALFSYNVPESISLINWVTGETKINYTSLSYPKSFENLANWMSESRNNFLRNRHTNFFGSNFGNIINIIENYILKGFFCGLFIAIFYPVGIVLFSVIVTLLAVIGLIFSFLWIIIYFLFNLLVFDADHPKGHCAIFPLIILVIWRVVICIGFSTLAFLVLCVVQLLTAIFMLFFGFLRYFIRTLYDVLTLGFIKCFAKVPKTDSSVAWKIKGPGINRTQFSRVSIDDALTLLRSEMEQIYLDNFSSRAVYAIDRPITKINNFSDNVLIRANCSIRVNSKVTKQCNDLKNRLYNQINDRKNIYPAKCYNIKFTEEELDTFLIASQDLIKDYVDSNNLKFIWKQNSVVEGSWDLLTEKILKRTFSEGIMENVDDCVEMIEAKQQDREILDQIEMVQKRANISGFATMAAHKRKKLAEIMDFDNEEDLAMKQKYLTRRKHTSLEKFDDTYQREVTLTFLSSYEAFYFCYSYIPKKRHEREMMVDKQIADSNFKDVDNNNSLIDVESD